MWKYAEEYEAALQTAFRYEDEVVVEECIKGREFSAGVLGGESLPIIEIIPKAGFYDYETKYQPGMAMDVCPAELSEEKTKEMQNFAKRVYDELKLEVYGRRLVCCHRKLQRLVWIMERYVRRLSRWLWRRNEVSYVDNDT